MDQQQLVGQLLGVEYEYWAPEHTDNVNSHEFTSPTCLRHRILRAVQGSDEPTLMIRRYLDNKVYPVSLSTFLREETYMGMKRRFCESAATEAVELLKLHV